MEQQKYEKLKISPFDAVEKNILPASKALITSYSLNIKGPFLSSFYPLRCSDMLCQSTYYAPVPSFFFFFYCGLQIGWDIWYGGSEDSDALLFSLIWLPVGHFVPPYSFMSLPSLRVSCLFPVMTIFGLKKKKKKSSEKTSEQICPMLGPFLNLKLG